MSAAPSIVQPHGRPLYEAVGIHALWVASGVAVFVGYRVLRRRRRRVTAPAGFATEAVLVVDLVESTRLAAHYGDGAAMRARLLLRQHARAEGEKRGLIFTESTGDGRLMTFATVPDAVETARALLAGLARQSRDHEADPPLAMRAAIIYGEVLLDGRGGRHGTVLNKAFRLDGLTEDQFVDVGRDTSERAFPRLNRLLLDEEAAHESERSGIAVRPVGFCRLKGLSGLHRVYEAV